MSHDSTLSAVLFRIEHLFDGQSPLSTPKPMQANSSNLLSNYSSSNMILNNDIADDLDRYLTNSDNLSDRSLTSSPTIALSSGSLPPHSSASQFEFILNALTASSARINEETTTYLNQGQPYEIKFHVNAQSFVEKSLLSTTYRSILRLCFWDKILQAQEHDLVQKWFTEYQLSSLFDIDMSLTYGILSIIRSRQIPNAVEIVWDSATTTSLFIRFKCTSTDFAQKRHGGEKGIPLRIQIDTYQEDEFDGIKHLHACCCKIQLFRSKGAQRKNKADKMRIDKLNLDQRRRYQTTLDCTVLQACPLSPLYTLNLLSLSYPPDDLSDVQTQSSSTADDIPVERKSSDDMQRKSCTNRAFLSSSLPDIKSLFSDWQKSEVDLVTNITVQSSHEDVLRWLTSNNFSSVADRFQHYTGTDLLRLTVNDIRRVCQDDDSICIRLFNQLHEKLVPPLRTFYIKTSDDEVYSAVYLHALTQRELGEKLMDLTQQEPCHLILEANKLRIKIDTDNVVKYSLPDQGQFLLKIVAREWILCLIDAPA